MQVSDFWVKEFVRDELGWTFQASTTAAQKLPKEWQEQMRMMTLRVAYLVKAYNIHPAHVVNADQTRIHLIPTGGSRTYKKKGIRDVAVAGKDNKRQITAVVSSAANGGVLPLQLIFTGKTQRSIPAGKAAQEVVKFDKWDLTASGNHWSNLETTKRWVDKVLFPYLEKSCKDLGRDPATEKAILLLDCWKVHKGEEFMSWLAEVHANIKLLFVPAGCTSKAQPADHECHHAAALEVCFLSRV